MHPLHAHNSAELKRTDNALIIRPVIGISAYGNI